MTAKLSTHVLDTSNGRPAAGMRVELWSLRGARRRLLKKLRTNADGRADSPLLQGAEVRGGLYELIFFVGDYFKRSAPDRFLDRVPVRFRLKAGQSYHVPLLCSPWSYATYRGS
jgi:5-hydroxyisourate hydrolase